MKKSLTTITIVLLSTLLSFAYDIQIDGLRYNLNIKEKTAEVAGGNYYDTLITIPSEIIHANEVYTVASIKNGAFEDYAFLKHIKVIFVFII